jgi:hypothetical protein
VTDPAGPERPEGPGPRTPLQPVTGRALSIAAVIGLVAGWLVHRVVESVRDTPPVIGLLHPLILILVAAVTVGTAWITWRQVQVHHQRLDSHRAVNRLVLGRACALVGALLSGGYLGYAVSWLGLSGDPLAGTLIARGIVCAAAGAIMCAAGVWLEHACRIREDDEERG